MFKKLISALIIASLLLTSTVSSASNIWYVRTDGGTDTQCTGLTNVAYPGSGTGQNCAFSHNFYLTGFYYNGTASTHGTMHMAGSDTVIFSAGSFKQGYDAAWSGCSSGSPANCQAVEWPSGSSGNPTKIYGFGGDIGATTISTTLYGVRHAYSVLNLGSHSYIDIKNLELTDHNACTEANANSPAPCSDSLDYAKDGIYGLANDHISLYYVNIHGMSRYGIQAGAASNWIFNHITVKNNGMGGIDFDTDIHTGNAVTGTMVMSNSSVTFNGCGETYPGYATTQCYGQDRTGNSGVPNGYGDGIAFGDGSIGQWTITDSSISHNLQDGFDGLHGTVGTDYIHSARNLYEGNDGQQMKAQANMTSENDWFIGDCNYFVNQSFTNTSWWSPTSTQVSNICRAVGTPILLGVSANQVHKIYGSTIYSIGDDIIQATYNSSLNNCNGTTRIYIRNSIIYAGRQWNEDSSIYPPGSNDTSTLYGAFDTSGGSTGACVNPAIFDEDYVQMYGTKSGSSDISSNGFTHGGHSRYSNPLFSGTVNSGPTTYSNPDDFASQLYLSSTSPARYSVTGANSADETLTFLTNGAIDNNSYSRGLNWDTGAVQYGSTANSTSCGVATGGACSSNSDCCTHYCSLSVCSEFNLRINGVTGLGIYLH